MAKGKKISLAVPRRRVRARKSLKGRVPRSRVTVVSPGGREYLRCVLGGSDELGKMPLGAPYRTISKKFQQTVLVSPRSSMTNVRAMVHPALPGAFHLIDGVASMIATDGTSRLVTKGGGPAFAITSCFPNARDAVAGLDYELNVNEIVVATAVSTKVSTNYAGPKLFATGEVAMARVPMDWLPGTTPHVTDTTWAGSSITTPAPAYTDKMPVRTKQMAGNVYSAFTVIGDMPGATKCSVLDPCVAILPPCSVEGYQPCEGRYVETVSGIFSDTTCPIRQEIVTQDNANSLTGGGNISGDSNVVWVNTPALGDQVPTGSYWLPEGHDALIIAADGVNNTAGQIAVIAITVEMCVEFTVTAVSNIREMAMPALPKDERALEIARDVTQKMPASMPPQKEGGFASWLGAIMGAVGPVASVLGSVFPIAAPVTSLVSRIAASLATL